MMHLLILTYTIRTTNFLKMYKLWFPMTKDNILRLTKFNCHCLCVRGLWLG